MNNVKEKILQFQRNEITEHYIYEYLSGRARGKNKKVLSRIGGDELLHYNEWKEYTKKDVEKNSIKILKYILLSRIFGITFAIKLMEKDEETAENVYRKIEKTFPKAKNILKDELIHENLLINMIEEEKLGYISSIVLGLNDALVEITGTLAGLTFALRSSVTIGVAGLITGTAASLSMAASEYLSQKSEAKNNNPVKASFYTFTAYLAVVISLILPFFLLKNYYIAFLTSLCAGVAVILIFSFFVSVVQDRKFNKIFIEMFIITGSVALISFLIGTAARKIFHINV